MPGSEKKRLGILGGMSWHSTAYYYSTINELYSKRHPAGANPPIILDSFCFEEVLDLFKKGRASSFLAARALQLEKSGAECLVIASNTVHVCYEEIKSAVSIPVLHIADGVAAQLNKRDIKEAALLGTRYTMTQEFYRNRLAQNGLTVFVPGPDEIRMIDQVITDELIHGKIIPASEEAYGKVIQGLYHQGAKIVILGCTELGMLVKEEKLPIPMLDTAEVHCKMAVDWLLG